jgi:O-antigen/teichoic acid export membrane protein
MSVLDSYYKIKVIPYNSLLIAKENFLFINIVILSAAFLRLGFILLLFVLPFDRLIFYSVIMFIISFMSRQITVIYVSKKYSESKVNHKIYYNQDLFKEILSFLKFSWIGQISNIIKKQGTNFLLNIFSGNVLLNAAYAAAGQVASISDMAFSPISQAIMPQALKSYSGNNKPRFKKLTLLNCKLAIILSWIFIIPLLFESDFILHIWLKEVPVFTSQFMILILIDEMIRQLSNGLVISNVVSEKVKVVYLANMFIQILSFILSFIFLKCGMKFWIIFYANIAVSIIFLFINLIFSNKYIYINALLYFFRVVIPSAVIGTCIILLMNLFKTYLSFSSPINSLLIMALSFLLSFILFFVSLFNKEESQKIISITKGTLKNLYTKR